MATIKTKNELQAGQREQLLSTLKNRFEKNMNRHNGLNWKTIQSDWRQSPINSGLSMKWN
jgi:biotin-(acetyl-CoA carboxylase) ligase